MDYLQPYLHQPGLVPSLVLVLAVYTLLLSVRHSIWRVALLALPGTVAHELTHWIVGFLLRARPHGLSVWPRAQGNTWRLGSVSFQSIGLLNGAWVALAPLLLLPFAWLCLTRILLPLWARGQWGWWLLAAYLTGSVLFAALPSLQDVKIGGRSLVLYASLALLLWWGYASLRGSVPRPAKAAHESAVLPIGSASVEPPRKIEACTNFAPEAKRHHGSRGEIVSPAKSGAASGSRKAQPGFTFPATRPTLASSRARA